MTGKPYREIVTCVCCGTEGPRAGRGLIRSCYTRHYKDGTLDGFPREFRAGQGPKEARRTVECVCCGTVGPHIGRGLIQVCHNRHALAGTLEQFPLIPESAREAAARGHETQSYAYEGRLESYAELLSWGESAEQAAERVGISASTARRYEKQLSDQPAEASCHS